MKLTKQLTTLALALLMAIAAPITALAEGIDANFTLTTVQTKFFAGLTYDVTATITDASAATALSHDFFEWTVNSTEGEASIATLDNYKYTDNGNGTYTVTETATVTMPPAGATANVTAKLGDRSKSISLQSLQPIESFDVNFINSDYAYFDNSGTVGTLYVERKLTNDSEEKSVFNVENVNPKTNDDEILIATGGFTTSNYTLSSIAQNSYELSFSKSAKGAGTLNFSVLSGGKAFKNYNIQVCIAATDYKLDVKGFNAKSYENYGDNANGPYTLTNLYTGKTFNIRASGDNLGNDDVKFDLYTDSTLTTKAPASYLHAKSNRECELNITEQGTYWLVSKNYSMDNGMLKRDLEPVVTMLVVNQSVSAETINLFELDEEGNKTENKLEDITLYTNTLTTYDLKKNISVTPDNTTDNLIYTSTNTAVATVSDGVITAKSKGDIIVYIKSDENANANAAVNVHVKIGVKAITKIVKQDETTIIPSGHIQKLNVTTNPAVVDEPIYWSSSNREVLSVDRLTGVITAKPVTESTIVTISAVAETSPSIKNTIDLTVEPANRATSLALSATANSDTYTEKQGEQYTIYSDYYQSTASKRTQFNITAVAPGANGEASNDEFVWTVSYNGGIGLSFEDAKAGGFITYTKGTNDSVYLITPQKQGSYSISCTATTNITAPEATDPSDTIIIDILQTASDLSVRDTDTGNKTSSTLYLPIGGTKEITVKSSTPDNDKTIDPPVYNVTSGSEYIKVTPRASDDGEGITYKIEGLSYGLEASKIVFASKSGSKSSAITVYVRNNMANAEVSGLEESYPYTGSAIKPEFSVYYGGSKIDSEKYSISYNVNGKASNVNAGTATITITGKGEYQGSSKVVSFRISPKAITADNAVFTAISDKQLTSTTRSAEPAPKVTLDGKTLTKDKDYTVSYKNNTAAGTATVTIIGMGNYSGTASTSFNVVDTAEKFTVAAIAKKTYSGKELKPLPVVKYNGKTLKKDVDYTLTYASNINPGVAKITIKGIGYYYGTATQTFIIKPKKNKIKSLKKDVKAFNVGWVTAPGVSGYQVQYALKKNFKKGKKTLNISSYYASTTATGLKKKKVYYVRVRSYVTVNGQTIYGAWSKVKKVKTK